MLVLSHSAMKMIDFTESQGRQERALRISLMHVDMSA
jgi:hypothetical protein